MDARRIGLWAGPLGFAVTQLVAAPAGMPDAGWSAAGLVWWMAACWMTEALPLSATALLPFLVLPLTGVANANKTASSYYSSIIFLFIGGAFLALAIERTGLHRRLALFIMGLAGTKPWQLLMGVMMATAVLSSFISNTSTALIMMPMAIAMLRAGGIEEGETSGMAGALPMGIAFAASIGGLGTLIGTPTNAIAAGLIETALGVRITFLQWALYGVPIVLLAVPLAAWIISRVQKLQADSFDPAAARAAIAQATQWTVAEQRLVPVVVLAFLAWVFQPVIESWFPAGGFTDGTVAAIAGLVLFVLPDGTGRPMLTWPEANRAPWDVVLMFGGGLAMAMGMTDSGLTKWMGEMLLPLANVPLPIVALVLVAFVIIVTEFASNIAAASGILPVIAALVAALGADPILLALPAAFAATWGFMLPAGTGPNALAWATGHCSMRAMVKAGFALDVAGVFLLVGVVWAISAVI
ncbi:MAG: C4-dicarboxylate ABC transporter [Novosphingobium sp. 28-62-57]|uniref:SLC13 family permease n=1 Tax=unclassified Novosphingobium TaxID=2644732 RepID=UPI000BD580C5|nr:MULTISPECIES: DASS family sodium-coupled anion symporter [unclassified Novosphingobium]OYW49035.1 MAG: C4-dicarboxylate ABC transporter [Novosphingobium sp. 12-62-10]OYZ09497.1 MAG: C4-dicarboxylate ABC transporter [Novosphingobium sp. 28-62-57]OZA30945.1 MAG: C4-dicarboxylate ABC transporter [Novosphingobium sp. 17-62-9]